MVKTNENSNLDQKSTFGPGLPIVYPYGRHNTHQPYRGLLYTHYKDSRH